MKSLSAIEAKFKRSKNKGDLTKLWKDTSLDLRSTVLQQVDFNIDETPIIIFLQNVNHWWLLTNERVIVVKDDYYLIINLSEIDKVELKALYDEEIAKDKCTSVQLSIKNHYFDLEVERGTWPLIYEILRFMISN